MPWPKGKPQPPEMIAKRAASFATPEVKEKMRQAKLGKSLSEEHRQKIAEAGRGRKLSEKGREALRRANTGKPMSDQTREKIRQALTERWSDPEYRQRMSDAHKGKATRTGSKASPETKERLRVAHTGKRRTVASRMKQGRSIYGPANHNWRGGPLPSNHRGVGWHTVKAIVRERAQGRCEFCGGENVRGWMLDVHHVIPYREIPISADWACLALCRRCHVQAECGKIDLSDLQAKLRPRLEALIDAMTS